MTSANPLQAVLTTTRTPPRDPRLPQSQLMKPELVERDGQGRVRYDRVFGAVHMESGPDAGTDLDAHVINICDPVKGEVIELDNVNRSAAIHKLAVAQIRRSASTTGVFCRMPANPMNPKNSSNETVEDLGRRSIEGFDALGWRVTTHVRMPNSSPDATLQHIRETWCSEELNAILLEVVSGSEDGPKEEIALTQIQRTEPDPSLFEIPADYIVSDVVQVPRVRGGSAVAQPLPAQPPLVTH